MIRELRDLEMAARDYAKMRLCESEQIRMVERARQDAQTETQRCQTPAQSVGWLRRIITMFMGAA